MKTLVILGFLLATNCSYGQSLEQHLIGSAGNFSTTMSGSSLSWSLGEPVVQTTTGSTATLTQGFQQIILVNPLSHFPSPSTEVQLQVFPNPTAQYLVIQKDNDLPMRAELINILGQSIAQYQLTDQTTHLEVAQLPAANYLLRVYQEDQQPIQTFKIQKIQ